MYARYGGGTHTFPATLITISNTANSRRSTVCAHTITLKKSSFVDVVGVQCMFVVPTISSRPFHSKAKDCQKPPQHTRSHSIKASQQLFKWKLPSAFILSSVECVVGAGSSSPKAKRWSKITKKGKKNSKKK
jgi:hypothetical protein